MRITLAEDDRDEVTVHLGGFTSAQAIKAFWEALKQITPGAQ